MVGGALFFLTFVLKAFVCINLLGKVCGYCFALRFYEVRSSWSGSCLVVRSRRPILHDCLLLVAEDFMSEIAVLGYKQSELVRLVFLSSVISAGK